MGAELLRVALTRGGETKSRPFLHMTTEAFAPSGVSPSSSYCCEKTSNTTSGLFTSTSQQALPSAHQLQADMGRRRYSEVRLQNS